MSIKRLDKNDRLEDSKRLRVFMDKDEQLFSNNTDNKEYNDGGSSDGSSNGSSDGSSDGSGNEDFWEKELKDLEEKDPQLYSSLEMVKNEIARTEPNIIEVLKLPLLIEDKTKLCQYYEIYKSQEPNTVEWLTTRTSFNKMLKEYKIGYQQYLRFSNEEHQIMRDEEENLSSFSNQLSLKYTILSLNTSKENKSIIYRRYEELLSVESSSEEYSKLKHWLTWATSIPHDTIKQVNVQNITEFIKEASIKLDKKLFGMEKIKEQILLFLSAKIINPNMKRSNLGLVGPPGIGKTTIARMIAEIMDWGFSQISFGGIDKADFLKGHEYTYVGAQPGEIVKCLRNMGHKNGVIFLDELDKASEHPDIRAALLHLVDQSQNMDFKDNFLGEISIDLSHIWYIGSMNNIPDDQALADRWWIINVEGYTLDEKVNIIKQYILPKALENINIREVTIEDCDIKYLIKKICKEDDKGVRTIQKCIADLTNKIHFILTHQDENGKLPFSTTFKLSNKLELPLVLNKKLLDIFISNRELNNMMNLMYL